MRAMRAVLTAIVLVTGACAPRRVEVGTQQAPAAEVGLRVTNNLDQAVNVYVVSGGAEQFVGQVPARATEQLPVAGVAPGARVTLRASAVGGNRSYTRDGVVLNGTYLWQVP